MYSRTFAFSLLSLFTSRQRAAEIEGDLIEESRYEGIFWFRFHVFATTFALFRESFKKAPFYITVLTVVGTGLSSLTCGMVSWMFYAPDAVIPVPALGLFAVFPWAFLIGFMLEYLKPGQGVQAATLTAVLLSFMAIIIQTQDYWVLFSGDLKVGISTAAINVFVYIVLLLMGSILSIVFFLAPLMMGSVYACNRSHNQKK